MVYVLSKVICVSETAQMIGGANKLGVKHWHYLFYITIENGLSTHRKADLEICKILRDPKKKNIVLSLDVQCCDALGQSTA